MKAAAQKLKKRHSSALEVLKEVAKSKFTKGNQTKLCGEIATELDTTGQTVINYINGLVKRGDGFLIEAITTELRKR